jgi:putative sterol carrier protein
MAYSELIKLNTSLVEVYRNVWGESGNTKWIRYVVENTMVKEITSGEGEDSIPEAAFRCFGDYKSYVSVCQRRLDPKMGILGGVFKLEGGVMAAMPMLPVYDKLTQCKRIDGMDF